MIAQASFWRTQPKPKRKVVRREAAALTEVLLALKVHPRVAWFERQNTGATKIGNRFLRFGWKGCSDVIGQLKDGRFLAVEVKAPGEQPKPEQRDFLAKVNRTGGMAFVARSLVDVKRALG